MISKNTKVQRVQIFVQLMLLSLIWFQWSTYSIAARIADTDSLSFRVMSYNIRYDNSGDGENKWESRKSRIAETIRFHQPDIVGIQEGLPHQVAYLSDELKDYDWVGTGRNGPDKVGEMCAIYYKEKEFKKIRHGTFWLTAKSDKNKPAIGWDAALPRIVTWVKLQHIKSGNSFYLFNTHFDHLGQTARVESARMIVREVDNIVGGAPAVLLGDFNTTPGLLPYTILTEAQFNDAALFSKYPLYGPTETFPNTEKPFHLPVDSVQGIRIDYIFITNRIESIHYATISNYMDGRFPSDHLPVMAELLLLGIDQ